MHIQNSSADDALKTLHSRWQGLTTVEANSRLSEFGKNQLEERKKEGLFSILFRELNHVFAVVLWIAAALCFVVATMSEHPEMFTLGWAIVAVIVINAIFSWWQSLKAERALEALQNILPKMCLVLRDNTWSQRAAVELVPGDIVDIQEGDTLAADVRLLECHRMRVDTSHVTGESLPAFRTALPDAGSDLLTAKNCVLAGMKVVTGRALGVVFATGRHSEFGKIAHLTLSTEQKLTPLQHEIQIVSRRIAWLALAAGIVFFAAATLVGLPLVQASMFAIGIIVANVPEGLMPTMTLSLALAAQRMAARNALIRRLPAVEALGSTSVICTDKTGTLTLNKLVLKEIDWQKQNVPAAAWQENTSLSPGALFFLLAMRHTHNLTETTPGEFLRGDPIEMAIVRYAICCVGQRVDVTRTADIPFDDTRRRQSVAVLISGVPWLLIKGAPEVIITLCTAVVTEAGCREDISNQRDELIQRAGDFARKGFKVLAFARRPLESADPGVTELSEKVHERDLEYLGLVALEDPLRPQVCSAVAACHAAGIRVIMITGDHPETARYVANECGIFRNPNAPIVLGHELNHLTQTQLQLALEHDEIAFARIKANQKARIVSALKAKNEIVAVTGDGVNDAPALRTADVGIAMGQCGTDVARESSDIVLLDDNFATIVDAIQEGRGVFQNTRNFITYILASNVPEAIPYILYVMFPIPLPLTIPQILAIDLGTDLLPAVGLGSEPPQPSLMQQPPRARDDHLINTHVLVRSYLWLGLWEAAGALGAYFLTLFMGGWTWGATLPDNSVLARQACTATFIAVILMQMVNVFLCRSRMSARVNTLMGAGVLVEILFVLILQNTSVFSNLLGTTHLPAQVYLAIGGAMIFMLLGELTRRKFLQ